MNYKGKLYGRIGNDTYFDTAYTTDDWDAMEAKIKEIEKVKRKPLSDGTLPMTESEKSELSEMMGYENISEIFYDNKLHFKCFDKGWGIITDVKAILYLAERFELTEK